MREKIIRRREQHYSSALHAPDPEGSESSERAGETAEQQVVVTELKNDESQLAAIDAALARIKAGTYGICLQTGDPIPAARLRALPSTPVSVEGALQLARSSPAASRTGT
jgi:RNA polymerase-binding transcription factor DksA